MRIFLAALALLTLAACGSGEDIAVDHGNDVVHVPMPTEVPSADGPVRTRDLVTVMDTGRPELCLGPVAESYPPQCGGPPLAGWSWKAQRGAFDQEGDIRWGQFAVTGTFDGTTFTVTGTIPAALYDAAATTSPVVPEPAVELGEDELAAIAERLGRDLPGAQGAYAADGHVFVDVTFDDGSLQAWADEEIGDGVVVVNSALVPAG